MILKNKRIFIVEDNAWNRTIFKLTLVQCGAEVEFGRWGNTIVHELKQFGPADALVLDLMLGPDISGYDVYDQIRALPGWSDVPIVAVSAADPSTAIPLVRAKGFAGFIAKPIDDLLFPQQLDRIINHEQVWSAGLDLEEPYE
jgi:two-component system, sensor histidine kinase and response regulator